MRSMLFAFGAIFVIAVCADLVLGQMGFSTAESSSGPAVRLGE